MQLVTAGRPLPEAEPFGFVLEQLGPVFQAWLSWIDPHGFIIPHRDAGPWRERWQVPIKAAGAFHTKDAVTEPADGVAFQVTHWRPHAVTNRWPNPRIHLVLDRDVWLDEKPQPFAIFPPPPEMQDLIERATN